MKASIQKRSREVEEANSKSDDQLVQSRNFLDRAQREHQQELDREIAAREKLIGEVVSNFVLIEMV